MALQNLEFLLVIVEPFGTLAEAAFALPENNGRRLIERAEESSTSDVASPSPGSIALSLNQRPKDITKGFVFGSDRRSCDVLLASDKGTGISANHFSIQVDWVSRDPMITCLSGNDLRAKVADSRTSMVLSKNIWQRLKSGTTLRIHVTGNLGVALFSPSRGDLQAAYDRNLQDYFLEYKNAVPELANISLDDDEVTPLILTRGAGLKGTEYYPIERIITGDVDYDTKVFVYNVMCKPTPDAFKIAERGGEGYRGVEDWLLNESNGGRPGEVYVVKHFRKGKVVHTPDRLRQLCHLNHLNLEDVVDLILEPSVFMVVTATFSHTTLDALHQEEPLSTEEAGFVMGQIFVALKYLHDCDLAHGNLDPRSIRVMSRKRLWIKLTDTAISNCFDLGKPDGYHATYTSQHFGQADKSPADIWSAGVVALQLLHGLPSRTGGNIIHQALWVAKLERHAKSWDQQSGTDASDTVRMVLKHAPEARPTATEVLRHQWILRTRGDIHVNNTHFNLPDPEGSRPTSVAPSASFSRHTSRQSSRQGSAPPLPVSRQSSVPPSELTPAQVLERMEEAEKLGGDYMDPDIDWNIFDSPSGSVRSQSIDGGVQTPAIDWKTGTVERVEGQRQAGIEDSGGETETGRRKPVTKKPRNGKAVPPHPMNLRSRVTPSSNLHQQWSATPRSPGYPGVTPTKSRHTSVKPSDSISRQGSVPPSDPTIRGEQTQARGRGRGRGRPRKVHTPAGHIAHVKDTAADDA